VETLLVHTFNKKRAEIESEYFQKLEKLTKSHAPKKLRRPSISSTPTQKPLSKDGYPDSILDENSESSNSSTLQRTASGSLGIRCDYYLDLLVICHAKKFIYFFLIFLRIPS